MVWGWGCSLVVEHLPDMHKALCSILSTGGVEGGAKKQKTHRFVCKVLQFHI
jgi:hypothetical protein